MLKLVGCITTHLTCLSCRHYKNVKDPCMNQRNICPVCIVELIPDKINFGGIKNWIICPRCGYREQKKSNVSIIKEKENTEEWLKEIKSHNSDEIDS